MDGSGLRRYLERFEGHSRDVGRSHLVHRLLYRSVDMLGLELASRAVRDIELIGASGTASIQSLSVTPICRGRAR
jgi:hypothetical protein